MEITWLFRDILELGDVCFQMQFLELDDRKKWETSWIYKRGQDKKRKEMVYLSIGVRYSNCFFQDVR